MYSNMDIEFLNRFVNVTGDRSPTPLRLSPFNNHRYIQVSTLITHIPNRQTHKRARTHTHLVVSIILTAR